MNTYNFNLDLFMIKYNYISVIQQDLSTLKVTRGNNLEIFSVVNPRLFLIFHTSKNHFHWLNISNSRMNFCISLDCKKLFYKSSSTLWRFRSILNKEETFREVFWWMLKPTFNSRSKECTWNRNISHAAGVLLSFGKSAQILTEEDIYLFYITLLQTNNWS